MKRTFTLTDHRKGYAIRYSAEFYKPAYSDMWTVRLLGASSDGVQQYKAKLSVALGIARNHLS